MHNPILAPDRDRPWEAVATFNPSAVVTPEGTRIFYRAMGNPDVLQTPHAGLSSIGTAFAEDGAHFHSRRQVIAPQEDWDEFGCEDPRVTFFEGKWYCFYTALGGYPFGPDNIKVGLAIGDTPEEFTERHLITPFNAKAAALFPERINGEVVLLLTAHTDWTNEHPRPTIAIARAKEVADFFDPGYWHAWHEHLADHALPELRRTDGDHVEVGAVPLLVESGPSTRLGASWLVIYSYIENYYDEHTRTFTIEAALLGRDNPQKLVSRTESFLVPQETYEEYGLVPRIVFPAGATVRGDSLDIWYGAADTVCAKASVRLGDLLRALDPERAARTFARPTENPILAPKGTGFESRDVLNAAAVDLGDSVYILYRAMDKENTSTIGLAISKDGVHIDERLPEPIYTPRADFEQKHGGSTGNSGCEDPRIVRIGNELHMTYTAYDGTHAPKGAHTSILVEDFLARRFERWSTPTLITPEEVDDKDTALLPEVIENNYTVYHRVGGTICADLVPDLSFTKRVSRCIEVLAPRRGMWDSAKVGIAGPPIKVDAGPSTGLGASWLMIYHGVSRHATYRLGAVLLDPSGLQVVARTADPIFEPLEPYELEGEVKNVVFSCGHIVRGDVLYLYYGAADKVIGVATSSLSRILVALT